MAKARKSKAKKSARKKAKPVKRARARKAKKAAPAKKPAPRKAVKAKKSVPKKKQKLVGEGDYAAAKAFDKDQTKFVQRNKAKIPRMAREAEQALDGPEGASIKAAEQEAMSRSTIE